MKQKICSVDKRYSHEFDEEVKVNDPTLNGVLRPWIALVFLDENSLDNHDSIWFKFGNSCYEGTCLNQNVSLLNDYCFLKSENIAFMTSNYLIFV